ncbi:MAG: hypothetical protein HY815_26750 [Candidatus Riflebacteria bacterium]|nr:hypothetical protein [Candidatus Riflebacteria bacterium]
MRRSTLLIALVAVLLGSSPLSRSALAESAQPRRAAQLLRGLEFVGSRASSVLRPGGPVAQAVSRVSPAALARQAAANYRDHRFYGTDLKEYSTIREALLRGSLVPTDLKSNVRGAFVRNLHPASLAGAALTPLAIEAQRQLASGHGLDPARLATALDPAVIGTSVVSNAAGDVVGAAVQSGLASLGPAGAAAGFLLRPAFGYLGAIMGMAAGENLSRGRGLRSSVASALRSLDPGRDIGQMLGASIGSTLGQVLLPIPVVGGIVGGLIGSTIGMLVGVGLSRVSPFEEISAGMVRGMGALADWIEGKKRPAPSGPPGAPGAPGAPAGQSPAGSGITVVGVQSDSPAASAGAVQTAGAGVVGPADRPTPVEVSNSAVSGAPVGERLR